MSIIKVTTLCIFDKIGCICYKNRVHQTHCVRHTSAGPSFIRSYTSRFRISPTNISTSAASSDPGNDPPLLFRIFIPHSLPNCFRFPKMRSVIQFAGCVRAHCQWRNLHGVASECQKIHNLGTVSDNSRRAPGFYHVQSTKWLVHASWYDFLGWRRTGPLEGEGTDTLLTQFC